MSGNDMQLNECQCTLHCPTHCQKPVGKAVNTTVYVCPGFVHRSFVICCSLSSMGSNVSTSNEITGWKVMQNVQKEVAVRRSCPACSLLAIVWSVVMWPNTATRLGYTIHHNDDCFSISHLVGVVWQEWVSEWQCLCLQDMYNHTTHQYTCTTLHTQTLVATPLHSMR